MNSLKDILAHSLRTKISFNWDKLKQDEEYKDFKFCDFNQVEPQYSIIERKHLSSVSSETLWTKLFKKKRRLLISELKEQAMQQYDQLMDEYREKQNEYNTRKENAYQEYLTKKTAFEQTQKEYNDSIIQYKNEYEIGKKEALERYVSDILSKSKYPDEVSNEYQLEYDLNSKTIVIEFNLPNPDGINHTTQYKYVASKKIIETIPMKQKVFDELYNNIIVQICLRTIYEVLTYSNEHIENVVFNGWVDGIDKATGRPFNSSIISLRVSRKEFLELNLGKVDIHACFRGLKGIHAGNLATLAPIKPIMNLKRDDRRFVESREILADLNSTDNLASIPWEDFEHLVRELFQAIFSKDGAEVKVTQASRDGGVDAIAFDPDPIKGGKFVIQAKRYNNVVPVSAVRDLYGTMINEGAVKGILVTTSHFGSDSYNFVKDKPISLIDGNNLVFLFNEHGYSVKIETR